MNENKLLACTIKPYTIKLDEGQIVKVTNEVWVGYWNRSGEFSAVCWDRIEDGRLVGVDSVTVTSEEFADKVCKVIDIFGDTESYNVRYLLSLSQTQIADYDKRIAELEKENAELKKDRDYFSGALDKQVEATLELQKKYQDLMEQNDKAKELLKKVLDLKKVVTKAEEYLLLEEAEQFLSEVEK